MFTGCAEVEELAWNKTTHQALAKTNANLQLRIRVFISKNSGNLVNESAGTSFGPGTLAEP